MYCLSIRSTTQNEGQNAPHQNSNSVPMRLCIEAVRRPSYNLKMMIFWGAYNFSVAIDRQYIFEKKIIFYFLFSFSYIIIRKNQKLPWKVIFCPELARDIFSLSKITG